jgi:DNA-binding GntR family transcriptional regulator
MTATMAHLSNSAMRAVEIADAIEDDIIFGSLSPHVELSEDALMARFGAKRHVVRQAIATLVERQIVVKPVNRSARVKDFTAAEVAEIYDMREILQREAVMRLVFPDAAELARIEALCTEHAAACAGCDLRVIRRVNDRFHAAIFELCPNATLAAEVARYNQMTNAIRSLGIADPDMRARAMAEHAEMVAALRARDRERLAEVCVAHIAPSKNKWLALRAATRTGAGA